MTLPELQRLAAAKNITITRKGYKMDGLFYRIEDWSAMLQAINNHDPLASQVEHWLRAA